MKAAYITETGPPSVIQYGDLPDPVVSANQVLVRTEAVSVNPVERMLAARLRDVQGDR